MEYLIRDKADETLGKLGIDGIAARVLIQELIKDSIYQGIQFILETLDHDEYIQEDFLGKIDEYLEETKEIRGKKAIKKVLEKKEFVLDDLISEIKCEELSDAIKKLYKLLKAIDYDKEIDTHLIFWG